MLLISGLMVEVSSADCQIKSFVDAGLSVTLRLDEEPLASTTQLVL
jgi:hypothetical protein